MRTSQRVSAIAAAVAALMAVLVPGPAAASKITNDSGYTLRVWFDCGVACGNYFTIKNGSSASRPSTDGIVSASVPGPQTQLWNKLRTKFDALVAKNDEIERLAEAGQGPPPTGVEQLSDWNDLKSVSLTNADSADGTSDLNKNDTVCENGAIHVRQGKKSVVVQDGQDDNDALALEDHGQAVFTPFNLYATWVPDFNLTRELANVDVGWEWRTTVYDSNNKMVGAYSWDSFQIKRGRTSCWSGTA